VRDDNAERRSACSGIWKDAEPRRRVAHAQPPGRHCSASARSGSPSSPAGLRALPLFVSLDDEQAERVQVSASEHLALTGEAVVEQWRVDRDLYVVLSGRVDVVADSRVLATLGPGDFFGELGAIEWGAGFARTRAATVTATEPTRLLGLDWALVNWLMKAQPLVGAQLEQVSRSRLATL
jgi:CRP-like cAMP-binding protein